MKSHAHTWLSVCLWLTVTSAGLALMLRHDTTPAPVESAPAVWPANQPIPLVSDRPTLVIFLHPKCPCSRATIAELAQLMADAGGKVSATVVMLRPASAETGWANTDTTRSTATIPGVTTHADIAGVEAAAFHATTSGETFLYDAHGRLRFHGGITGSRGHIGDNPGLRAVQSLVHTGTSPVAATATFGCPLQSPSTGSPRTPLSP